MSLSKERIGELALIALVAKFEKEGLMLKPKEVKRNVVNTAKNLGLTPTEFAEFSKIVYEKLYTKTIEEFDKIILGKVKE